MSSMEDDFNPNVDDGYNGYEDDYNDFIYIPIRLSDKVVAVNTRELPEDANEILDILKAEIVPLDIWIRLAVAYYKQGKIDQFKLILQEGSDPSLEEYYRQNKSERIAILNTLSAYYTKLATETSDKTAKAQYYAQATQNYNKADTIDQYEELTWLGKGVLLLSKGDYDRAQRTFDTVLAMKDQNTPALLGKACIAYHKGSIDEALKLYRKALETNPVCPASVRLGLGLCYYKLKKFNKARQCFERVLELEPEHVEALVSLGVLELNSPNAEVKKQAMQKFSKAYNENPSHPRVLNYLSNHFFYKKDFAKAETLAKKAYSKTEVIKIKAESYYYLGRCYQAQGNYDHAFNFYFESTRLWPEYALAQFGLGQMYIYRGDTPKAIKYLEMVLKTYPENYETLKILGSLYIGQPGKEEKALQYMQQVTEAHPKDWEAWIDLGRLQEKFSLEEALVSFQRAQLILQARKNKFLQQQQQNGSNGLDSDDEKPGARVSTALLKSASDSGLQLPAELWNNLAVFKHRTGRWHEARLDYLRAIHTVALVEGFASGEIDIDESNLDIAIGVEGDEQLLLEKYGNWTHPVLYVWRNVTTVYNLARLLEQLQQPTAAESIYTTILSHFPNYTDCLLRLACMQQQRGQHLKALEYCKDCIALEPNNVDAWTLMGNFHMTLSEWNPAQKKYEQIINPPSTSSGAEGEAALQQNKHDPYALIALGNIFYAAIDRPDKAETYLKRSFDFYSRVLQRDPSNVYAANGVAIILAEKGEWISAKEFFFMLCEALSTAASRSIEGPSKSSAASATAGPDDGYWIDVWINFGHVCVKLKQHNTAIKAYERCLAQFFQQGPKKNKQQQQQQQQQNKQNATSVQWPQEAVRILMFLANAHFDAGNWTECKKVLEQAIHIQPQNQTLWYNLAITEKEFGRSIIYRGLPSSSSSSRKKLPMPKLSEVKAACKALEYGKELLTNLANAAPRGSSSGVGYYNPQRAQHHSQKCQSLLDKGQELLVEVEKEHLRQQEQFQAQQEIAQKAHETLKSQQEQKLREREEAKRMLEEQAAEAAKRSTELLEELRQTTVDFSSTKRSSGKKRKRTYYEGGDEEDEEDSIDVSRDRRMADDEEEDDFIDRRDDEEEDVDYEEGMDMPSHAAPDEIQEPGDDDEEEEADYSEEEEEEPAYGDDDDEDEEAGPPKRKKRRLIAHKKPEKSAAARKKHQSKDKRKNEEHKDKKRAGLDALVQKRKQQQDDERKKHFKRRSIEEEEEEEEEPEEEAEPMEEEEEEEEKEEVAEEEEEKEEAPADEEEKPEEEELSEEVKAERADLKSKIEELLEQSSEEELKLFSMKTVRDFLAAKVPKDVLRRHRDYIRQQSLDSFAEFTSRRAAA